MTEQDVTVMIAEDYLDRADKVIQRCAKVGLNVKQHLKTLGVVQGTIDPAKIPALTKVAGVAAVELPRAIDIPSPDSEIQ